MKHDTPHSKFQYQVNQRMESHSVVSHFIAAYVSRKSLAAIYRTAFSWALKCFARFSLLHVLPLLPSAQIISLSCCSRCQSASTSCWSPRVLSVCAELLSLLSLSLFDSRRELMSRVIKSVCSSNPNSFLSRIPPLNWYQSTTFSNSLFINSWLRCWFKMPTTRQKRKASEPLLPGLPEEKRPRSKKSAGSTPSRKPAPKKGKKVLPSPCPLYHRNYLQKICWNEARSKSALCCTCKRHPQAWG